MDGWGSLTMLIKRQEAAKNRKAALKYELKKRKENLIKEKYTQNLKFPEISNLEMTALKKEIRKKHKKDKIKNNVINLIIFIIIISLFYYFFAFKKW